MKGIHWLLMASLIALLAGPAQAQVGPGAGRGGVAKAGASYTPGWSLMSREERKEHRERMRAIKSHEECESYLAQHHEKMAARAKEKGGKPLAQARRDACKGLKP